MSAQPVPFTVTVKLQETMLLDESIAVQVTTVVPDGKLEPEGGLQTVVTQLPVVVGSA